MQYGEDYYRSENTEIMNRKMMIYTENEHGVPVDMEDPYKANNKLASGFFKLLVDQKLNYSLGKDIAFNTDNPDEIHEILGRKFQSTLKTIAKESSKKSIGWGHVYIDDKGVFKLVKIPSEQLIPLYSNIDDEELEAVVRYYTVVSDGEPINRVEVWDKETVTYYQQNGKYGAYYLIGDKEMFDIFGRPWSNPRYHLYKSIKFGERETQVVDMAWGEIPFIPLYNNDEEDTDLQPIKNYIDVYDVVESDFANNLEDFQDIYWILKGYQGENVGKFLEQVKRYKALKVSEDGDAKAEKLEVPYEARMTELKNLEDKIFTFGQGVNLNQSGDGNITNVVIRSRFANLDLKANGFELEVEDFIDRLIYFVNKYREFNNMPPIEVDGVVFNRSMIINEVELLESNTKQKGMISEDTRLANHPWVEDVETEVGLIKEETDNMTVTIPDIEEGEDIEPREES